MILKNEYSNGSIPIIAYAIGILSDRIWPLAAVHTRSSRSFRMPAPGAPLLQHIHSVLDNSIELSIKAIRTDSGTLGEKH